MKNIFKNAKFGDKFVTRDGSCALFLEGSPYSLNVTLWVEDAGESYYYIDGTSGERIELDVMGRWEEKDKNNMTNKEKAREISLEYAETDPMDNCNCFPFKCTEEKASYYSALSMAEWKDEQYMDMKPILLTRDLIERNGWKLVSAQGNWEEIYEKRVQEGKDNDTYSIVIYMEKPYDGKVVQVWIYKELPQVAKKYREYVASLNHRSSHESICVHTFKNLLNLAGLKETSEEFKTESDENTNRP